jgi:hypothetical protein
LLTKLFSDVSLMLRSELGFSYAEGFCTASTISVSRGRIVIEPSVIEPSERVEYNLDDLLAGITRQNTHAEVSFGKLQR